MADLAELARHEGLWFHVDAAYGGAARLSARDAGRVPALELADSVTIDPHKWFFQAYDIGGLLVRDRSHLEATFSYQPEYYRGGGDPTRAPDAHGSGELDFYRLGLEGTRRFRALKLWLSWRHLGTPGLGRLVEMNDDLAALLARKVADSADFEACPAEPELSVVCFRHLPDGRDGVRRRGTRRHRRPPGRPAGSPRAERPRLPDHDPAARAHLAARRHPQLHGHRGRPRHPPRRPAAPGDAGAAGAFRRGLTVAPTGRPRVRGSRGPAGPPAAGARVSSRQSPQTPTTLRWPRSTRKPRASCEVVHQAGDLVGPDLPGAMAERAVQVTVLARRSDVELLASVEPVGMADEADVLEDIQRAVDRRRRGLRVLGAAALHQLGARDVSVGPGEHLDEQPALRRPAQPTLVEALADLVPAVGEGGRWVRGHLRQHTGMCPAPCLITTASRYRQVGPPGAGLAVRVVGR